MRSSIFILLLLVMHIAAKVDAQQIFRCGTPEKGRLLPGRIQAEEDHALLKPTGTPYVIPVVFHVLHLDGPENISDDQVKRQIEILNEDFNKQNDDTTEVIPIFKNLIADIGITFRLAKLDPNGIPTTGINHIYTTLTNHGWDDSSKINQWPPDKYLNIWVAKDLQGFAAAYSWYPSYAQIDPARDGIMTQYDYVGDTGTGNEQVRHALTHEVGHFFNLKHPFDDQIGSGPCGDDEVEDTPVTQSSGCDLGLSSCNPPVIEMVQNFMTGSYCEFMFTEGQRKRMDSTLNSNVGNRMNLWQPGNLIATGVEDGTAIKGTTPAGVIWQCYPNPAGERLYVTSTLPAKGILQVKIFDINGRIVFKGAKSGHTFSIPTGQLQDGLYQLTIEDNHNRREAIRFIRH